MVHHDVLERYKVIFGDALGVIDSWYQNGKNSVRIRYQNGDMRINGKEVIFTVGPSGVEWRLETRAYFEQTL